MQLKLYFSYIVKPTLQFSVNHFKKEIDEYEEYLATKESKELKKKLLLTKTGSHKKKTHQQKAVKADNL